mmetsp:Transcript_53218/g.61003  ORF Transcript_53218/g.61003 Transcript_53218/m.61003 type:complete len:343 (-) Transcript_53218:231-1259(-)
MDLLRSYPKAFNSKNALRAQVVSLPQNCKFILVSTASGSLIRLNLQTGDREQTRQVSTSAIISMSISNNSQIVAIIDNAGHVSILQTSDLAEIGHEKYSSDRYLLRFDECDSNALYIVTANSFSLLNVADPKSIRRKWNYSSNYMHGCSIVGVVGENFCAVGFSNGSISVNGMNGWMEHKVHEGSVTDICILGFYDCPEEGTRNAHIVSSSAYGTIVASVLGGQAVKIWTIGEFGFSIRRLFQASSHLYLAQDRKGGFHGISKNKHRELRVCEELLRVEVPGKTVCLSSVAQHQTMVVLSYDGRVSVLRRKHMILCVLFLRKQKRSFLNRLPYFLLKELASL